LRTFILLLAALTALATAGANAGAPPANPSTPRDMEAGLRDSMKIPAEYRFVYQGIDGSVLSREQFTRVAGAGAHFEIARDDAHKTIALKLIDESPQAEIGAVTRLPDFNLPRIGGGRARSADLLGRVTLVNFFFETCAPCIKEAPMLNAFRRQHPQYNYLAVTGDTSAEAQRFVRERKLEWPVVADAGALLSAVQLKGFPTYLLVAADGRILGRGAGMDMDALDDPAQAAAKFEKWVTQRLTR
jgi:peroxiredoxin